MSVARERLDVGSAHACPAFDVDYGSDAGGDAFLQPARRVTDESSGIGEA
jgi:hypothetical protein